MEFEITNFKSAKGKDSGSIIYECKTKEGIAFDVRPRGTIEQRRDWFKNGSKQIGKQLTVRYFELTADNIPRFPVGICVRDYE